MTSQVRDDTLGAGHGTAAAAAAAPACLAADHSAGGLASISIVPADGVFSNRRRMGRSTEHFLTWQSCVVLQMQLRVCHTCTVELPDAATLDL
jgi:hypothetical protein